MRVGHHTQKGKFTMPLETNAGATPGPSPGVIVKSIKMPAIVLAHIGLMVLGWGIMIPIGIAIVSNVTLPLTVGHWYDVASTARNSSSNAMAKLQAALCKNREDWFQLHRGIQIVGFLFGTIGAVLGIIKAGGVKFTGPHHIVGHISPLAVSPHGKANS